MEKVSILYRRAQHVRMHRRAHHGNKVGDALNERFLLAHSLVQFVCRPAVRRQFHGLSVRKFRERPGCACRHMHTRHLLPLLDAQ